MPQPFGTLSARTTTRRSGRGGVGSSLQVVAFRLIICLTCTCVHACLGILRVRARGATEFARARQDCSTRKGTLRYMFHRDGCCAQWHIPPREFADFDAAAPLPLLAFLRDPVTRECQRAVPPQVIVDACSLAVPTCACMQQPRASTTTMIIDFRTPSLSRACVLNRTSVHACMCAGTFHV